MNIIIESIGNDWISVKDTTDEKDSLILLFDVKGCVISKHPRIEHCILIGRSLSNQNDMDGLIIICDDSGDNTVKVMENDCSDINELMNHLKNLITEQIKIN